MKLRTCQPDVVLRCALLAVLLAAQPASAQQAPSDQPQAASPAAATGAKSPAAAGRPAARTTPAAAPVAGDAGLKQRVEQLEEQLVDLQVVIGTLESLAKTPAAAAAPRPAYAASPSAADAGRVDTLETQIRALTQQLEQLSAEVRAGRGTTSVALQPPSGALRPDAATVPQGGPNVSVSPAPVPQGGDPIGGMINENGPDAAPAVEAAPQMALATPSGDDAKLAYEAAYGHMLQQDYGAAQAGFAAFLKSYSGHALVPNALYWLGETYYVQRNYADAAEAFDIVLAAHGSSNKAPDAQLKKAMSLSLLGKNAEACSALKQLSAKYPNAPTHVKSKADSERRRVGCT